MEHILQLEQLYSFWKNKSTHRIIPINSASASSRCYFRIYADNKSVIGVHNADLRENKAYFYFSKTFSKDKIHVPELYIVDGSEQYYLIQDLGDMNLLALLKEEGDSNLVKSLYLKSIDELLKMQFLGLAQIDFEKFSYPRAEFDAQSLLWDLNYFKYYFLKVSGFPFDEQLLENDFDKLAQKIQKLQWVGFMFRDFQARNIQVFNNEVWLIDYQGGRKGPLLYDLASLLYQASAQLSNSFREELKSYYKEQFRPHGNRS